MNTQEVSPRRVDILRLLSIFRFLDTIQIQELLRSKDHRNVTRWLKDLRDTKLIEWLYAPSFGENARPAVYFVTLSGARFLAHIGAIDQSGAMQLSRDASRSTDYREAHLLVASYYLELRDQKGEADFAVVPYPGHESQNSPLSILIALDCQLVFRQLNLGHERSYTLEVYQARLSEWQIRRRLIRYLNFFKADDWPFGEFPELLFVCTDQKQQASTILTAGRLLDDLGRPEQLSIHATTRALVAQTGLVANIWFQA